MGLLHITRHAVIAPLNTWRSFPLLALTQQPLGQGVGEVREFTFQVENVSPSETLSKGSGDSNGALFYHRLTAANFTQTSPWVALMEDQEMGRSPKRL